MAAMAVQTSNLISSTPLGGLTNVLQGGLSTLLSSGHQLLDRFFPPDRRQKLYAQLTKFATEKPMLASFLLSQIALSGIPLALFAVLTVGVLVFALVAGLVVAVVGALLFTVVVVGFALIVLLPTLFVTTFAAAFIWLWGVGAYYIIKWFNEKPVSDGKSGSSAAGVGEALSQPGNLATTDPLSTLNNNINGTTETTPQNSTKDTKDTTTSSPPKEKEKSSSPNPPPSSPPTTKSPPPASKPTTTEDEKERKKPINIKSTVSKVGGEAGGLL